MYEIFLAKNCKFLSEKISCDFHVIIEFIFSFILFISRKFNAGQVNFGFRCLGQVLEQQQKKTKMFSEIRQKHARGHLVSINIGAASTNMRVRQQFFETWQTIV